MAGDRQDSRGTAGTTDQDGGAGFGRRGFLGLAGALGSAAALGACGVPTGSSGASSSGSGASTGTVRALFMQQAGYSVDEINAMTKAFETANPGLKVENTFVAYEALHDKIVISAPAGTFDVVLIDCIWPTELASKKMILDVTDRYPAGWDADILPGTLGAVTYQDKRYGVPWIAGGKVFFYNGALLTKAGVAASQMTTWEGCVAAAKTLKAKKIVEFPFIWSWSQAEAIICDYTQLLGAFGGSFLDAAGKPAFNTGGGLQALEWMVMTLDEGLTNPASTKSLEDDVKKSLLSNQAVMALNWDYVYAASHDAKETSTPGQVVMATSPAGPGGKNPGCDGGMGLSITAGCKNPDAAWKLIAHLASKEQMVAHSANTLPIWKSAYTPELSKGREQMVEADQKTFGNLIERPPVANYNAISQVLQASLQQALLGQKKPKAALDDAAKQIAGLLTT
jgi:multiple sugar transport system substrate-binding protein